MDNSDSFKNLEIGRKIRTLRESIKFSELQVAEFLGIDQEYLRKLESDEVKISSEQLREICDLFGCSDSDIVNKNKIPSPISYKYLPGTEDSLNPETRATINRLVLNLKEMQEIVEKGSKSRL
jgi:transcriptional regulator with XRE-family HTH domain